MALFGQMVQVLLVDPSMHEKVYKVTETYGSVCKFLTSVPAPAAVACCCVFTLSCQ